VVVWWDSFLALVFSMKSLALVFVSDYPEKKMREIFVKFHFVSFTFFINNFFLLAILIVSV
jgi:hypothetical protein